MRIEKNEREWEQEIDANEKGEKKLRGYRSEQHNMLEKKEMSLGGDYEQVRRKKKKRLEIVGGTSKRRSTDK